MEIKINGNKIDIDANNYNSILSDIQAPLLQPILRDTSPNALRREQMKHDFNNLIVGINIKPDFA